MAIIITKNFASFQPPFDNVDYPTYSATSIQVVAFDAVLTLHRIYLTQKHFNEGFLPVMNRGEYITDPSVISQVMALQLTNLDLALRVVEQYLVGQTEGWYADGTIV